MSLFLLALGGLALAALPAGLGLYNLRLYRRPPAAGTESPRPAVSILIPARNEEASIARALDAARASGGVELEILVLDDRSTDGTAEIVRDAARRDPRVRLLAAPPLPPGWCGKQHACARLAAAARHPLLLFQDADVRLEPDGAARLAAFLDASGADLASGVPRQETGTLLERLVIPLIHVILLGYLPLARMRRSRQPAYAAGCGQLFLARRDAYRRAGGHDAIRASRHDGVKLPRVFRRAGLVTDLCDATDVARCRMYRSAGEVWRGFAKNADEGMAAPAAILPWTVLLLGGHVLPPAILFGGALGGAAPATLAAAGAGTALVYLLRAVFARRFRQPILGALLHPVGITLVVAIQWYALARGLAGRPIAWKGRATVEEEVRSSS